VVRLPFAASEVSANEIVLYMAREWREIMHLYPSMNYTVLFAITTSHFQKNLLFQLWGSYVKLVSVVARLGRGD